jgi:hypothetical protein
VPRRLISIIQISGIVKIVQILCLIEDLVKASESTRAFLFVRLIIFPHYDDFGMLKLHVLICCKELFYKGHIVLPKKGEG